MTVLDVLVWVGTITFAASGALQAVAKRFDLLGVLVLAAVTAVGGGAIRDVTVGVLPPSNLANEPLLWGVFLTGALVFVLHNRIPAGRGLYALDTLGLGIFAALGAQTGVAYGLGLWGTVFAGAISGVGGGILRDVLSGEVPGILYRAGDFYASAAAIGAAVVYGLNGPNQELALIAGAAATIALRAGSRLAGLNLPVPRTR